MLEGSGDEIFIFRVTVRVDQLALLTVGGGRWMLVIGDGNEVVEFRVAVGVVSPGDVHSVQVGEARGARAQQRGLPAAPLGHRAAERGPAGVHHQTWKTSQFTE